MSEVPVSLAERLVQAATKAIKYVKPYADNAYPYTDEGRASVVAVLRELAKDTEERADKARADDTWAASDLVSTLTLERWRLVRLAVELEENRDA